MQGFHIGQVTAVLQQVGHLVVQVERRTHDTVHRLLVNIGSEEFHDIGIGLAVGKFVIAGIERIHVVGLDINVDNRSFVSECTGHFRLRLNSIQLRFLCLLAGK